MKKEKTRKRRENDISAWKLSFCRGETLSLGQHGISPTAESQIKKIVLLNGHLIDTEE